jgi:hypothetical protein
MKKAEMKENVTYVICPKKTCRLFWDVTGPIPCEGHCPHEDKQKLVILCHNCEEMIVLPGGTHIFVRIDHQCKGQGGVASNFRMSGVYHLLYKIPKN